MQYQNNNLKKNCNILFNHMIKVQILHELFS